MLIVRNILIPRHLTVIPLVLYIFLTVSISAQTGRNIDLTSLIKKHAAWDPTEFIIDKIMENRIVMIGDNGHGDPLYYKIVLNSLNRWLSTWERTASKVSPNKLPKKLILVLEMDSIGVNSLKHYFISDNPIELIQPGNFWGYQFTTATLEFYYDLKNFWQRVEDYNHAHEKDIKVTFDIFGPEKVIDLSIWTTAKKDSFFIYERDEYSSEKVINLLERNPDAKALIYYGDAHLTREKVQKMQNPQSMGFYIAYYLTERFASRESVYTCNQIDVLASKWIDPSISEIGKTFAVDNSIFSGVAINPNAYFPARDGSIFEFSPARQPRYISTILSENLINYALDSIDTYRDTTKEFYRGNLSTFLYYLSTYNVVDMQLTNYRPAAIDSAIIAWKEWRNTSKFDLVQDITSLNFFKRYVDRMRIADEKLSTTYKRQLARILGFKVWFQNDASPQERADSIWSCIIRYRKTIIIENLINLLWIGLTCPP